MEALKITEKIIGENAFQLKKLKETRVKRSSAFEQLGPGLDLVTSPDKKNIRILHPHDSGFIAYSKISTLESGFKKLRTRIADSQDTCGQKLYPERKSCGFKNIRIFVDGASKTWFDKR